MSTNYVRGASITAAASQSEIQQMLADSGASSFRWTREGGRTAIAFRAGPHWFRIVLALPPAADRPASPRSTPSAPPKTSQDLARQRWRQLSVLIRAKLDAVDSGIATFDQEFMAYMLDPTDATASILPSASRTRA